MQSRPAGHDPAHVHRSAIQSTHPRRTRVAILGATGSIGTNAIDVCTHMVDQFEIHSLTAVTSWKKLAEAALDIERGNVAEWDAEEIKAYCRERFEKKRAGS